MTITFERSGFGRAGKTTQTVALQSEDVSRIYRNEVDGQFADFTLVMRDGDRETFPYEGNRENLAVLFAMFESEVSR